MPHLNGLVFTQTFKLLSHLNGLVFTQAFKLLSHLNGLVFTQTFKLLLGAIRRNRGGGCGVASRRPFPWRDLPGEHVRVPGVARRGGARDARRGRGAGPGGEVPDPAPQLRADRGGPDPGASRERSPVARSRGRRRDRVRPGDEARRRWNGRLLPDHPDPPSRPRGTRRGPRLTQGEALRLETPSGPPRAGTSGLHGCLLSGNHGRCAVQPTRVPRPGRRCHEEIDSADGIDASSRGLRRRGGRGKISGRAARRNRGPRGGVGRGPRDDHGPGDLSRRNKRRGGCGPGVPLRRLLPARGKSPLRIERDGPALPSRVRVGGGGRARHPPRPVVRELTGSHRAARRQCRAWCRRLVAVSGPGGAAAPRCGGSGPRRFHFRPHDPGHGP